jgi:acetate kinase
VTDPARQGSLLVVTAGSSSIKFSLYAAAPGAALRVLVQGELDGISTLPHFIARDGQGAPLAERRWDRPADYDAVLAHLLDWIDAHLGPQRLIAAGHRVAHGGLSCSAPLRATPSVMAALRAAIPLAPLHQPHNLAPIDALLARHPQLPQVVCFDTGFHATNPGVARMYGLPQALTDEGIRRFGFHGLSYEFIAGELARVDPKAAAGRTIVAHLGSGASMCALVGGKSVATTMGFSALDGLPMGTRCGVLDPGVILYLLQQKGMQPEEVETLLYQQSGLLGVSGLSGDMRQLLASDDSRAHAAIDLFVYRAARELGSLAAAAGGLDALVFTAGIGEHAAQIRARICEQSAWLGVRLDGRANDGGESLISTPDSGVAVRVIATDEQLMVARHTLALVLPRCKDRPTP